MIREMREGVIFYSSGRMLRGRDQGWAERRDEVKEEEKREIAGGGEGRKEKREREAEKVRKERGEGWRGLSMKGCWRWMY